MTQQPDPNIKGFMSSTGCTIEEKKSVLELLT